VPTNTLVVAEDSEFDVTRDRVYLVLEGTESPKMPLDIIKIKNDEGVEETYSTEYFRFYKGEAVDSFRHL
jgi:hypothetical protein